jgi:hypothetical protein
MIMVGCIRPGFRFIFREGGQELFDIVNSDVLLVQPFQQISHRRAELQKREDKAARPGEREGPFQGSAGLVRLVLFFACETGVGPR